jgi:hypothetical protein
MWKELSLPILRGCHAIHLKGLWKAMKSLTTAILGLDSNNVSPECKRSFIIELTLISHSLL